VRHAMRAASLVHRVNGRGLNFVVTCTSQLVEYELFWI
jgi:hypothetical protein